MSAQQRQYVFQSNKPKLREHTKSRKGCLACKARKVKVKTCCLCTSAVMSWKMDADLGHSVLKLCRHVRTVSGWASNVFIHIRRPSCQRHLAMWSNKTRLPCIETTAATVQSSKAHLQNQGASSTAYYRRPSRRMSTWRCSSRCTSSTIAYCSKLHQLTLPSSAHLLTSRNG